MRASPRTTASRARKALVVISDGGDNASQATLEQVLARARDSNAAIYTVGIYDPSDVEKNPRVLKSLAHTTGDHFAGAHWMLTGYHGSTAAQLDPIDALRAE